MFDVLFFIVFLLIFLAHQPIEKVCPFVEVLFINETDTLGGQGGLGEIAVVGLVISTQTEFSVLGKQPDSFKVSDKIGVCQHVLAITEVTVDEQSVVQQTNTSIPACFQGVPITLVTAAFLSLGFMGFSGLV